MALFKLSQLKRSYEQRHFSSGGRILTEQMRISEAKRILERQYEAFSVLRTYDVFLSHSLNDAVAILQLKHELERNGLSVYVDWVEDPVANRREVNKIHADRIRKAIKASRSFLYAFSENSKESKWMQWELGYADAAKKGRVAIVPIEEDNRKPDFFRREFLGLYPYIELRNSALYVKGEQKQSVIDYWLSHTNPYDYY